MTLTIRPNYSEQVGAQNRTLVQYGVMTGDESSRRYTKANFPRSSILLRADLSTYARWLCAKTAVDLLVRLDPLVQRIGIETPNNESVIGDLPNRFPVRVSDEDYRSWDCRLGIGVDDGCDLHVDSDGWLVYLNRVRSGTDDDGINPIGPLAGASLIAGEVFKMLVPLNFPDSPLSKRMVSCGTLEFSTFSYKANDENPQLKNFMLDATVVGAGGIAAGLLTALSNLSSYVTGRVQIIDDDTVTLDNLNRLTYATVADVERSARKADSAARYMYASGNLRAFPHPKKFGDFKEGLSPLRRDRKYELMISTVDNDDTRLEVQRELPYDLLDAGTGVHANCRVEHVRLLDTECLGCRIAAQPLHLPQDHGDSCGCLSDNPAPSVSFLSFFPGVLLAGEIIKKYSFPGDYLEGYLEHIFLYPPNPENRGSASKVPACTVRCQSQAVVGAYKEKYGLQ